jgi:hypothetical protein
VEIRDTRYARAPDGAYIAFQTTSADPIDLAWHLDWLGNVDLIWEAPASESSSERSPDSPG